MFGFRYDLPEIGSQVGVLSPVNPKVISGLKETFIKRNIVERNSKAETRSEEQSVKAESCRENLWNKIQLKGP